MSDSPVKTSDEIRPPMTADAPVDNVFNAEEALCSCFKSPEMLAEMIQYFFHEVENVFRQMCTALEKGDLLEVGRVGHRLKGTIAYLGAQRAREAVQRVERFCTSSDGTPCEAQKAIAALQRECLVLQAALQEHASAAAPKQGIP
jgi:HPt (histidine-containing phosphotransfer) domain-containing protein